MVSGVVLVIGLLGAGAGAAWHGIKHVAHETNCVVVHGHKCPVSKK